METKEYVFGIWGFSGEEFNLNSRAGLETEELKSSKRINKTVASNL